MKRVLVYYSMSDNTDYVAKYIKERLDVDLIRLVPKKEYPNKGFKKFFWRGKSAVMGETPPLEPYDFSNKYDLIIIGSPIWAGTFTPPIRTFIKDNKEILKDKKIAVYFTHSGGGSNKAIVKLKELIGIDNLIANLSLIDPKDKQSNDKDKQIEDFIELLK